MMATSATLVRPQTAAQWFVVMQGAPSQEDRREFELWLAGDPAHEQAYRALEIRWAELGLTASDRRVLKLRAETLTAVVRRRSAPQRRAAVAAMLAIGVACAGGGWWWVRHAPVVYETGSGERLNVTLNDRSQVDLAPHSRLRVRFDGHERRLELERGQAYFAVAHETRPFRVHAADRVVTAVGTQFQVGIDGRQANVVLVEGRVAVDPVRAVSIGRTFLEPGQRLSGALANAKPTQSDVEVETAWRVGRLVFREQPLTDVVAKFNDWSTVQIEIGEPMIAGILISGSFQYDGADDFITALESGFGLSAETTSDGRRIILRAKPSPSA